MFNSKRWIWNRYLSIGSKSQSFYILKKNMISVMSHLIIKKLYFFLNEVYY